MSRTKGSKNKPKEVVNKRPHEIVMVLPKHPLKYQAKRLYWALLQMEKRMAKDITSVKMSEYSTLLASYIDVVEQLKKQGITYGYNKEARSGMVIERVDEVESDRDKATVSRDELSRLGIGV